MIVPGRRGAAGSACVAIKTIPVEDLVAGAYVVRLHGPWLHHPFWRTRFIVDDDDVATLKASPVRQVDIDADRGAVIAPASAGTPPVPSPTPATEAEPASLPGRSAAGLEPGAGDTAPSSFADELARARVICREGYDVVAAMFGEARMGRTLALAPLQRLASRIEGSVSRNPTALVSLARLKTADSYTYLHSVAVAGLMVAVARELRLPAAEQERAALAGLLHDVGKALVPLEILNKPGKLLDAEFDLMRGHPAHGERLLRDAGIDDPDVLDVVRHHHERIDGAGYPDRLADAGLSLLTRASAVCDVYDAITSNRPYKAGWDPAESLRRMASWDGHFDPDVLKALVRVLGIFPVGSLVRLESGHLAVVTAPGAHPLAPPHVRVFYSTRSRQQVLRRDLDLATGADRIVGIESPQRWGFRDLEKLWLP